MVLSPCAVSVSCQSHSQTSAKADVAAYNRAYEPHPVGTPGAPRRMGSRPMRAVGEVMVVFMRREDNRRIPLAATCCQRDLTRKGSSRDVQTLCFQLKCPGKGSYGSEANTNQNFLGALVRSKNGSAH